MKEVKSNFNGFKTNIEVQRVSDRAGTEGIGDSAVREAQTSEEEFIDRLELLFCDRDEPDMDTIMKSFNQWFMVILAKAKTFDNVYQALSDTREAIGNVRLSLSCYLEHMDEGVQHYESVLT